MKYSAARGIRITPSRLRRAILWPTASLAILCAGSVLTRRAGLWLNITTSLPPGLYQDLPRAPIERGAVVVACLPPAIALLGRVRGYLISGERCPGQVAPVGKTVLALPADTVVVANDGLEVNGAIIPHSRPVRRDAAGRPLGRMAIGQYVVRPGELWIFGSSSDRSWDSRYYGALPQASVLSIVRPLLTF